MKLFCDRNVPSDYQFSLGRLCLGLFIRNKLDIMKNHSAETPCYHCQLPPGREQTIYNNKYAPVQWVPLSTILLACWCHSVLQRDLFYHFFLPFHGGSTHCKSLEELSLVMESYHPGLWRNPRLHQYHLCPTQTTEGSDTSKGDHFTGSQTREIDSFEESLFAGPSDFSLWGGDGSRGSQEALARSILTIGSMQQPFSHSSSVAKTI